MIALPYLTGLFTPSEHYQRMWAQHSMLARHMSTHPKETEMAMPNINPYRGLSSTCTGNETPVTRFESCVAALVGNAAQMSELVDRLTRVADRLGGQPPAECTGTATDSVERQLCIAEQLERVIELHKSLTARAERTLERLEAL